MAALFLPSHARANVYALYSWCRSCDDSIDLSSPCALPADRHQDLARLREWTFRDPVVQSLISDHSIRKEYFEEMLAGMEMDIDHQGYRSEAELEQYCFRVAGVVGLMMSPLIGAGSPAASDHAIALGIAMQLTNICRDVFEDAQRGRVYLPLKELNLDSVAEASSLLAAEPEMGLAAVRKLLARADELYSYARKGFRFIPLRTCLAIALAGRLYQLIGHRLLAAAEIDKKIALRNRTVVPWTLKIAAIAYALAWTIKSRWEKPTEGPPIFPHWSWPKDGFANPKGL